MPLTSKPAAKTIFWVEGGKFSFCVCRIKQKKRYGQSVGHSPAVVQMGRHMEAISGPGAPQRKVVCSLSSEPLKNRLAALTCNVWART